MEAFLAIKQEIERVTIGEGVLDYIMQIVRKTRETESIRFGASTRAGDFNRKSSTSVGLFSRSGLCDA